jgi:hypothetical protein
MVVSNANRTSATNGPARWLVFLAVREDDDRTGWQDDSGSAWTDLHMQALCLAMTDVMRDRPTLVLLVSGGVAITQH